MVDIGLDLADSDQRVILRFENFPKAMHDRLLAALLNIEQRLESMVIAAEPQLTGALRSMTGGRVYDDDTRLSARVGVRAPDGQSARKAMALEYGSHNEVTVRAHSASLAHFWARAVSPITVTISAHQRQTNIAAYEFMRAAIATIHEDAIDELRAAVSDAATSA